MVYAEIKEMIFTCSQSLGDFWILNDAMINIGCCNIFWSSCCTTSNHTSPSPYPIHHSSTHCTHHHFTAATNHQPPLNPASPFSPQVCFSFLFLSLYVSHSPTLQPPQLTLFLRPSFFFFNTLQNLLFLHHFGQPTNLAASLSVSRRCNIHPIQCYLLHWDKEEICLLLIFFSLPFMWSRQWDTSHWGYQSWILLSSISIFVIAEVSRSISMKQWDTFYW